MTAAPTRRVLLVSPYYAPAIGGVERYVEQLVHELRHIGWAVSVVTTGPAPVAGVFRPWGSGFAVDEVDGVRVYRLPVDRRISNTPVGRGWRRGLSKIIATERPDVINAHAPVPLLADMAASVGHRLPFVLTYHTGRMRKNRLLPDLALRLYESTVLPKTISRADRVICSSDYVAETFAGPFFAKSSVIKPGVDLSRFQYTPPPRSASLLFVGSLMRSTSYKGLSDLLRAVAILSRAGSAVSLRVVGSGDALESYQREAAELGISNSVDFTGALSGDALSDAYRDSRMLVLPTHFDSLPTVIVEAMASGRPVLSTPVGGIPSLLEASGGGLMTAVGDPAGLAEAIRTLPDDEAEAMGRRGRTYVERNLSWGLQGRVTSDVLDAAITQRTNLRPRRVAVLAPYFAPHVGGVERYAQRLTTHLHDRRDVDPLVITTHAGRRRRSYSMVDDVPVVALPSWAVLSNTPVNPLWGWQLRRLFQRLGVDVVHAHTPVPFLADVGLWAAGPARRTILTYHSGTMVKGRRWTDGPIRLYERLVLPRLFNSADVLTATSRTCLPSGRPDCAIWPPGVDATTFHPGPRAPSRSARVVMYVGRIERSSAWKGVGSLVDAFAKASTEVPDARLVLVGGGDAVADHLSRACELGIGDRVEASGPLSGQALVNAYGSARVVVLPSLTDAESFGMTLIEAMACGRPVIGSRVGGIPEVLRDGVDGLLVAPGNVDELAAACVRVLHDDALADVLGAAGRARVETDLDWSSTLRAYDAAVDGSEIPNL